ncbi:MAG: glycosyl transferase, partial [Gemmatimonadales bacterium]|nr:glycosyl transferase [Gemmatimonadales bacterium]
MLARRWFRLASGLVVLLALLGTAVYRRARLDTPPATTMLLDRHGRFLGEVGADERLGFWSVDPLPVRVVAATLIVEDRRFYSHPGIAPRAVARAIRQNVSDVDRVSGASTIAMQVARLQDPGRRTYLRKVVESLTALALVGRHGRKRVLAQYLTLAPYGNNVHGISYAARRYFNKPVEDLSWAETAFLAGMPQSPSLMNPYTPLGRARGVARAERILDLLLADGALPPIDHDRAVAELASLHFPPRPVRPAATLHPVLHFERTLKSVKPMVHTTLDLDVQTQVQQTLRQAIKKWEERGAGNAAAVVVRRDGWEVLAAVGSTDWANPRFAGAIDYTRTPRYPGSTLKPFVYAASLDRGDITPNTILDDLTRGPDG